MAAEVPGLDFRVWPNLGDEAEVRMAAFDYNVPPGMFAAMPNLWCILFLGHGINYFLERHRDQLDDALSEYKEAVRLDHFHSRALLQLAATRENAGRYRAAIARWSPLTARRRS